MKKVNVLFVCMGNICRSPTAHGVFEQLVESAGLSDQIGVDSAGTHAYHIGEPPDQRSQAAAALRNIDLSPQRARQVEQQDFERFDYVLAMDHNNLAGLQRFANQHARVQLLMDYAQRWSEQEVPDPYYGGGRGFEQVLDMIEDASAELLKHIVRNH